MCLGSHNLESITYYKPTFQNLIIFIGFNFGILWVIYKVEHSVIYGEIFTLHKLIEILIILES